MAVAPWASITHMVGTPFISKHQRDIKQCATTNNPLLGGIAIPQSHQRDISNQQEGEAQVKGEREMREKRGDAR